MLKGYNENNYNFSDHFDHQFLDDLYAGDTKSAEEVFQSSLIQIEQELEEADALYAKGDLTGVRKLFHRIKPLFGYVGLLSVQDYVQQFENSCLVIREQEALLTAFNNIKEIIRDASGLIREEKLKLSEYNKRRA